MNNLNKLLVGVISTSSLSAFAVPSLYNGHPGAEPIKNTTAANVIRDSQSAKVAWVMPPAIGATEMSEFYSTGNIGFCPSLQSLFSATNALAERMEGLVASVKEDEKTLKLAETDLLAEIKAKSELAVSMSAKDLILLDNEISAKQDTIFLLLESLDSCSEDCTEIAEEYQSENTELNTLKDERAKLGRENRAADRALKQADAKITAARDIMDTVGTRIDKLLVRITSLNTSINDMYAGRGKLEGGFATIDYQTGWQKAVAKLSEQNPSIDFSKIPTRNTRIHANFIGATDKESYLNSLPAILDYNISGHKFTPWGERNIGEAATGMPELIAGSLRLSLIGACPLAVEGFFKDKDVNVKESANGNPLLALSATYEYPTTFKYKVEASYNLYRFYEKIKKKGKRGGFFSSKAYASLIEDAVGGDTFEIKWEEQDDDFTQEQRLKITAQLKEELTNRVLKIMAEPIMSSAPAMALDNPGVPPENGAVVLANGLNKSCGFNLYCKIGSWVLKGANAIWGSSSTEERFKQTWDRTATEIWSSDRVSYRADTVSFSAK